MLFTLMTILFPPAHPPPLPNRSLFAIVKVLTVAIHALGLAIDAFSYGLRILRGDACGHIDLVPFAPWLRCVRAVYGMWGFEGIGTGTRRVKSNALTNHLVV